MLDLGLPGLDGLEILKRLHAENSPARVLILTARGEVGDRVKGLKAGADDYLTKPFSMDELVARVEALGRRGMAPTATDTLKVADLHMDVHHRRVTRAGQAVPLSPREFELLLPDGERVWAQERFFVVRVADRRLSREGWTALEQEVMADHRWWSPAELASTPATVWPERLADLLRTVGSP